LGRSSDGKQLEENMTPINGSVNYALKSERKDPPPFKKRWGFSFLDGFNLQKTPPPVYSF
jgi:hypothetical protein